MAEILALEASATSAEPVLYADAADINLNPKIGQDWMLPGQKRRIATTGKNKKFYVAGALDVHRVDLHFLPPYCPDATRVLLRQPPQKQLVIAKKTVPEFQVFIERNTAFLT